MESPDRDRFELDRVAQLTDGIGEQIDTAGGDVLHARHPVAEVLEIEVEVLVIESITTLSTTRSSSRRTSPRSITDGDLDLDLVVVAVPVGIAAAEELGVGLVVELREVESVRGGEFVTASEEVRDMSSDSTRHQLIGSVLSITASAFGWSGPSIDSAIRRTAPGPVSGPSAAASTSRGIACSRTAASSRSMPTWEPVRGSGTPSTSARSVQAPPAVALRGPPCGVFPRTRSADSVSPIPMIEHRTSLESRERALMSGGGAGG